MQILMNAPCRIHAQGKLSATISKDHTDALSPNVLSGGAVTITICASSIYH
jgi:hypothetical protein